MVNHNIVMRLLNNISSYLTDLEEINSITLKHFSKDIKTQRFSERTLQITIEAMLDIAHHIISDEKFREPESYADAFTILNEHNIISDEFCHTAKLMAQFRNKLVHYYENIDPEIVYTVATTKTVDIISFIEQIKRWLMKTKTE